MPWVFVQIRGELQAQENNRAMVMKMNKKTYKLYLHMKDLSLLSGVSRCVSVVSSSSLDAGEK